MAARIFFVILLAAPPVVVILLGIIRALLPGPPRLIKLKKGRFDTLVHARIQDPTELLGRIEATLVKLNGPKRPFEPLRSTPGFEALDAWNRLRSIDGDVYKGLVALAQTPVERFADLGRPVVAGEFDLNGAFSSSLRGYADAPVAEDSLAHVNATPVDERSEASDAASDQAPASLKRRAEQAGEDYKHALQTLKGQVNRAFPVSKREATSALERWRGVCHERLPELERAYRELPLRARVSARLIAGEQGQTYLRYRADLTRWEQEVDRLIERWDSHFGATETFFDLVLAVAPDETAATDHIDRVERVRAEAISDAERRYDALIRQLTHERETNQ